MPTGTTEGSSAVIIGSGHLAYRVNQLAKSRHVHVQHLEGDAFGPVSSGESRLETLARVLADVALESSPAVFLVDENDERNLELLIALISMNSSLRIVAALFNENVAPHLQAAHPNIRVLNPAKIAAPTFVAALDAPRQLSLRYAPAPMRKEPIPRQSDHLVRRLVLAFVAMIVLATSYFHAAEGLSLLDSLYFVVVTTATVGYGDINLAHSGAASKVVGILMILTSTVFIWMIFSLTVDRIIKQRVQLSLGRRKYNRKGHVILCGLGRLGYFVAEGLLERGEDVLVIERDESSANVQHFRAMGIDVFIGDARLPAVLSDAGVSKAKALFSLVDSDFGNLEIGLNARSFDPTLRLILRIYDDSMSKMIRENLDIQLTYSMTAIADEAFFDAVLPLSSSVPMSS
jgi:voltage-gated potassium channel Kch